MKISVNKSKNNEIEDVLPYPPVDFITDIYWAGLSFTFKKCFEALDTHFIEQNGLFNKYRNL